MKKKSPFSRPRSLPMHMMLFCVLPFALGFFGSKLIRLMLAP